MANVKKMIFLCEKTHIRIQALPEDTRQGFIECAVQRYLDFNQLEMSQLLQKVRESERVRLLKLPCPDSLLPSIKEIELPAEMWTKLEGLKPKAPPGDHIDAAILLETKDIE